MSRGLKSSPATMTIIPTVISLVLAGVLVNRVAWTAESIRQHANSIDEVAITIDEAALAVTNLDTTNQHASAILTSAEPLDGKLAEIARLAASVDAHASSISGSASTVVGTAAAIDDTAGVVRGSASGINGQAAQILAIARSIDRGLVQINANLDETIAVVRLVEGDTTTILDQARKAHQNAACIDEASEGGDDGHCDSGGRT